MAPQRQSRWLSLGEAASVLGVDEATLRHWADTGRVKTFRTPGGHRRFQEEDLRALIQQEIPKVENLGHLVERRSAKLLAGAPAKALRTRPWFPALTEDLRARARGHGRQLFGAVVEFVAKPAARKALKAQLLEQGRTYGIELQQAGMTSADAAEAFGYFRHLVLQTVTEPRGRGGMLDEEQVRVLLDVSDLLDTVFLAMLRAWSGTGPKGRREPHGARH